MMYMLTRKGFFQEICQGGGQNLATKNMGGGGGGGGGG